MTTPTKETREQTPPADSPAQPREVIGRFVESGINGQITAGKGRPEANVPIAIFCHEPPESFIGAQVLNTVPLLARRGRKVHLFSSQPFDCSDKNVQVHAVGSGEGDAVTQAKEFVSRAGNAFMQAVPAGQEVALLAYEWSAAGVLPLLRGLRNQQGMLSLHSTERQRSDLSSEISRQINDIECEALNVAGRILVHDEGTAEQIRKWVPPCADRIIHAREPFPVYKFNSDLDPAIVKARYEVGPIDPVLLFVGDLDERYGPDLLVKAMPALLRHHPQARLVIVGDGHLQWPLRVFARYLLLEYAIRIVGSVVDEPLCELIQAADVICVPSRESTPWWPILAGWAAKKPVVATHDAAKGLTDHEKDSVLVYPSENSVVWGVERVLYDADLRKTMGETGHKKLEERFGYNALAEQLDEILTATQAAER